ncbi:acyl-CoA dehydrogenase C-terminal domain-containing protein [Rhodobacter sp. Har01]|uniref:acyl-CoA dehydrogenase C-terminal domain-containing protein n=1 Tax=Rhodobacter sp. Har01 TaxID=2883999 RepID=UPI001D08A731|nr:acyl-CoA dehydrogenase C-terminal domain-containing protein [Rhodobacter sp. Har01]MCB6179246.1 acyl-CoA dehydrogenase C-terminal domain-containing protein [Rhodobacter sp. Har01]
MPGYTAPVKDMQFLLHDVLQVSKADIPGYGDLDESFTEAVLTEAGRVAADLLAPLNAVGDHEGCTLENGVVRTPAGFREAFASLRAGGWTALDAPVEFGGQGLPYLMHSAVNETFVSANMAFNMYQGLTHGACSAILAHGTDAQKATYVPRLVSCDWTGTMNLTEPQCGTDLGLMRTRAEPQADGSYRITGQKIFISAGEHDLAENIVHLVLAKAPGGGEGTKGISLFIVPKLLVNPDGSLGARNALRAERVEHKMGIHGSATCVMAYEGATGYLLGELHKGMKAMFTMMNEARLGVGLQGYAVAEAAYQAAATYARDRLQGRAVTGAQNPSGPADPLIVHPDIRRSLMEQKSFVEGARAFTFWGATLIDRAHRLGDDTADGIVSLLTPVLKGFQTDMGFAMAVQAQQVFGGHGYIEDTGVSQFVRDARIAMIYEGANGVQALDLVGRKLAADGGKPVMAFFDLVKSEVKAHDGDARMQPFTEPLKTASKQMQQAAMFFMANAMKTPDAALAGSTDFLHLAGHVCLGLMWTRMAKAAHQALDEGRGDAAFLQAKIATGRFFMARQLPACALHLARIETGADPVMALPADAF